MVAKIGSEIELNGDIKEKAVGGTNVEREQAGANVSVGEFGKDTEVKEGLSHRELSDKASDVGNILKIVGGKKGVAGADVSLKGVGAGRFGRCARRNNYRDC